MAKNCKPSIIIPDKYSVIVVQNITERNDISCKLRQNGMIAIVVEEAYAQYQIQTQQGLYGICDNNAWVQIETGTKIFDGSNLVIINNEEHKQEYLQSPLVKVGQMVFYVPEEKYYRYDGYNFVDPFSNKLEKPTQFTNDPDEHYIPVYDNELENPQWLPSNILAFKTDVDNVETSKVPYNGANKDVNIASNYFKTSKGFDFTFDENNYFRTFNNGSYNNLKFQSKDSSDDNFGYLQITANAEEGFNVVCVDGNEANANYLQVNINGISSSKAFVSGEGFKTPFGTSNQFLMADGSVSILTNPITGTGTTNYIPKFLSSGTVGNSLIYDNGTNVGIGTTSPQAKLDIKAQGALSTDIAFRVRNSTDTRNFLVVNGAGDVYNRGAQGIYSNTFFGENVGRNTTGTYNSAFGYIALGSNTTGNFNNAFGFNALYANTTGNYNNAFGVNAGRYTSNGSNNEISNNSVYLGHDTRANADNETNQIVIGYNTIGNGSNSVTLGNDSITKTVLKGKVGIGTITPSEKLEVSGSVKATGFKTPNGTANQALTANGGVFDLNEKANIVDIPTKTSFTHDILVSNWTLVGGKYEAVISNSGILSNSFVDVIPSDDNADIVIASQIYLNVLISEGNVKVYSKFLPSGTISVTINIY